MRKVRELLQDLGRYLPRLRERARLRNGPEGTDYGQGEFRMLARRLVDGLHPRTMQLEVVEVVEETASTRTFRCVRRDGPLPPFRPGQYLSLKVQIGSVHTSRAYSISSAPGTPHLDLTVRANPGGFVSPYLFEHVRVGYVLSTSGPEGSFGFEPLMDRGELVLLAGGSGITPFMSIVRDAARSGFPRRIHLLYGSRRADDVIFGTELAKLAAAHEALHYALVISEPGPGHVGPSGLLTADFIRTQVGIAPDQTFLVCGPAAMGDHCERALAALGVPPHKVRREVFGSTVDVSSTPGWPVDVPADGEVTIDVVGHGAFRARAGETLLSSLERAGLIVPSACRTGECAECRVRIEEGPVHLSPDRGIRASDRALGYVHACVAYPTADVRVRLAR